MVADRIGGLRERRFQGRQTFEEFMTHRFDPAIRTTASTRAPTCRASFSIPSRE
ncbi:DUF3422 family protein [Stappia indica]|nr:DUF3422 family protein [Stappia indica]